MAAALVVMAEEFLNGHPVLNHVLTLCGFENPVARMRVIEFEGLDTLDAFGDFDDTAIENMAKRNEGRSPQANRVVFGIRRILKLKAVAFWVRKQRREGVAPDDMNVHDLDADVVATMIREMSLSTTDTKRDEKLFYPSKFNPKKYISWARSFENYLDSLKGKSKVPLSYIIRSEALDPEDAEDDYQRLILSAPHEGYAYEEDNREVYRIYKDLMVDTDGWTWFNRAREGDGRGAHLIIMTHYRGDAETARRAAEAEAQLDRLFYKNEAAFPFETYVTHLNECFELLKDNEQALSEAQKVKRLLKGVTSTNQEVIALKAVVRSTHPTDFDAASTLMAGQIAILFPAAAMTPDTRYKRKISVANTQGRGRGRFNTPGGRGLGPQTVHPNRLHMGVVNGVDITDPTRTFTSDEWNRLRESGLLSWVMDRRNNRGNGRGGGRQGRFTGGRGGGRGFDQRGRGRGVSALETRVAAVEQVITTLSASSITNDRSSGSASGSHPGRGSQSGSSFGSRRYVSFAPGTATGDRC
jgi:hypothetical protein